MINMEPLGTHNSLGEYADFLEVNKQTTSQMEGGSAQLLLCVQKKSRLFLNRVHVGPCTHSLLIRAEAVSCWCLC